MSLEWPQLFDAEQTQLYILQELGNAGTDTRASMLQETIGNLGASQSRSVAAVRILQAVVAARTERCAMHDSCKTGLYRFITQPDVPHKDIQAAAVPTLALYARKDGHYSCLLMLTRDSSRDVRLQALLALRSVDECPARLAAALRLMDTDPLVRRTAILVLKDLMSVSHQ